MSFFSLKPQPQDKFWLLEYGGKLENILTKLDPFVRPKMVKLSEGLVSVDSAHTFNIFSHLILKSCLYFQAKPLHADLFTKACIHSLLGFDSELGWHLKSQVRVGSTVFFLHEALCNANARWIIHKGFFYAIDEGVDKRALSEGAHVKSVSEDDAHQWIKSPDSFSGYSSLQIDPSCQMGPKSTNSSQRPTLKLRDYGLSEIELWLSDQLIDDPNLQAPLAYADLLELAALWWAPKKCFKWDHPDLASDALALLQEMGWILKGPHDEEILTMQDLDITMSEQQSHSLEASGEAIFKDSFTLKERRLSVGAMAAHLKRELKLLPLPAGALALISAKWNQTLQILKKAHAHQGKVQWQPWQVGLALEICSEGPYLKAWRKLTRAKEQPLANLRESENFTLRPYQRLGVSWLLELWNMQLGGLLADDMGLGKTIQALTFLYNLEEGLDLVVMPLSLLSQWHAQASKVLIGRQILVHHGPKRQTSAFEGKRLVLTTYQTLVQDKELFNNSIWRVAIFDESHFIRNPSSQAYLAACGVRSFIKIAMSGTPIFNSLDDLWAQMQLLAPSIVNGLRAPDASNQPLEGLSPLWMRRTKQQVASDLPDKIEQIVWLDMDSEQKALYERTLQAQIKDTQGREPERLEILEKILRLRQCCLVPSLVEPSFSQVGIKQQQLLSDLEQILASGQKVLVFSQFAQVLETMYRACIQEQISCYYIDSATRDRTSQLHDFEHSPQPCALFMTLGIGSVGLNLTCASYVILLDPWWNESTENQAIDRTHRIGQKQTVNVIRYMIKGSLEEAMQEIKEKKKLHIDSWQVSALSPLQHHADESELFYAIRNQA